MKKEILKLRAEGKTYNQIQEILGCSKSTIAYHCGEGQKSKNNVRSFNWKKDNPIKTKTSLAKSRLRKKINDFKRRKLDKHRVVNSDISIKDVQKLIKKFQEHPFCYLSGRRIDLNNSRSYHLDHVVPIALGGDNSIDNLGLTCREANIAKGDMNLDNFINLCLDILNYQGYNIEKMAGE